MRLLLERSPGGQAPGWFSIGKGGLASLNPGATQPPQSIEVAATDGEVQKATNSGRMQQVSG